MRKLFLFFAVLVLFTFFFNSINFAGSSPSLGTVEKARELGESLGKLDLLAGKNRTDAELRIYVKDNIDPGLINNDEWMKAFIAGYRDGIASSGGGQGDWSKIGETAGKAAGKSQALKDAYAKLKSDPYRSMPDTDGLIREYGLSKLNSTQLNAFITGFRAGYIDEYNKNYTSAYDPSAYGSAWAKQGKEVGKDYGIKQAEIEFKSRQSADPMRGLPTDSSIISMFGLERLSPSDKKDYIDAFKASYIEEYNKKYAELLAKEGKDFINPPKKEEKNTEWYNRGKELGKADGEKQAILDYYKNLPKNPFQNMPTLDQLVTTYQLYKLTPTELRDFHEGYMKAYPKAYESAFSSALVKADSETWSEQGNDIGARYGAIQASKDYHSGLSQDAKRSMPSDSEIVSLFGLNKISLKDRESFISMFKIAYVTAYKEAYAALLTGEASQTLENGVSDGDAAGRKYAEMVARSHYENGKAPSKKEIGITDSEIIAKYNLSKMDEEYKKAFVAAFKEAYYAAYDAAYRKAALEEGEKRMKGGSENGKEAGEKKGERDATIDLMKNLPFSPERNLPTREKIIQEFNLSLMESTYAEDFIAGYIAGYKDKYNSSYKEKQGELAASKRTQLKIGIEGGDVPSGDDRMGVSVPGGAYYDDVFLTITQLPANFINNTGFIEASKPYRIEVTNPNGHFNKKRKVGIAFKYYGDPEFNVTLDANPGTQGTSGDLRGVKDGKWETASPYYQGSASDAGVYMLDGSTWKYVESKRDMENNAIIAFISPETLAKGGAVFSLLVDESYTYMYDIRKHWAKEQINAMVRRGVIVGYSDKTFRPDQPITRAEFLTLLSRHYNWKVEEFAGYSEKFSDFKTYGYYKPYIDYGTAQKYIIGYSDGTFKPNRNITYQEIDWIMQRITSNYKFTWKDYAKLVSQKKGVRSKSYDSMKNKITRAEFSYLMYEMDKWRY